MESKLLNNGVFSVRGSGGTFQALWSGVEYAGRGVVLVCFSAAVTSRSRKSPPFFSGKGLSERNKLACVSIHDDTLSFSNDINLAWYGGNQSYPLFQQDIADFLDKLSESFKLIMVGGSGGGFAALAISSLMKRQADILVFNLQTSISEYGEKHVLKYLETAFPEAFNESFLSDSQATKKLDPYCFREFLETTKIVHDVTNVKYKNKRIIYLQNRSDHHLKKHAWPFFKFRFMLDEIKNIKTSESDEHCVLHLGDWGAGHVAPPVALIDKCTNFLASGVKLPLSRLIYEANL